MKATSTQDTAKSGSGTVAVANLVPSITPPLVPDSVQIGSAAQTLTINGANFLPTSTVTYNGASRAATYGSSTRLTIQLSSADLGTAGVYAVVVNNPAPGGGASNGVSFTVNNRVPAILGLLPLSVSQGSVAQTLIINGTNFLPNSTVTFNGVMKTATYVNSAQLTISLSAADQATPGSYPVVVSNPAPGGGTSNSAAFTVNGLQPQLYSLSPSYVSAGASTRVLTITGLILCLLQRPPLTACPALRHSSAQRS